MLISHMGTDADSITVLVSQGCDLWFVVVIDSGLVGCNGEGHKTGPHRRVTYPESYITKYTSMHVY
jgi:hypothetical protein